MKFQYLLVFVAVFGLTSCNKDSYLFTSFREPATDGLHLACSKDGYKWTDLGGSFLKPEVGGKLMRDPSIVRAPDGTYHLVWTTNWKGDKGFGYAHSSDLIHWSMQEFIPVMEHEPEVVNVWAPELFYDEESEEFVIIWASTIPFRFAKGEEDEKNNHRMYYTTTKDFKTFSKAALFADPGFSIIDAVIVRKEKGKYVLVLKDNTRPNRNIKVAFSDKVLGSYTNVSAPFTGYLTEGPTVAKVGKDWLIYFDQYRDKTYGAVKTTDFKEFVNISDQVVVPKDHKHGTITKINRKTLKLLKSR
ncbi:glycoside hydrolase family 43 protein [Dyadobacter sp. LHD-138]|uniref:glycoside hydrolase family 43 protein n=1 Tax=Dyadobacter sp. LHD-138 TaxID=3071413 RepID=UPI0027E02EA7|nr:glycoside hydrolase family 43 protein [Dyadobacter sp. LHD-138]MDQ6479133.1 glycoside hydrolase family 43 protein [Dyadobacter sp. LHD-138]